MTISTKEVRALFKMLTKVGSAVVNRWSQNKKEFFTIPVVAIDPKGKDADQIGFTTPQRKIHLNPYHEYITDLPEKEKQIKAIKGVWTHEIMHQLMTDFALSETLFRRPTQVESEIYHTVFNIVEDARIEYFAPSYIGGGYTTDEFDKDGSNTEIAMTLYDSVASDDARRNKLALMIISNSDGVYDTDILEEFDYFSSIKDYNVLNYLSLCKYGKPIESISEESLEIDCPIAMCIAICPIDGCIVILF